MNGVGAKGKTLGAKGKTLALHLCAKIFGGRGSGGALWERKRGGFFFYIYI